MCMWFARQFFSIAVSHFFYLARGRFSATPPPVPLVCVRTDCTVYRQALLLLSRYVMGPIFPRPCKCGPQHPSLVSFSVKSACVRAESSALVLGPQRLWPPNRFRSDVYWCPRTLFRTALKGNGCTGRLFRQPPACHPRISPWFVTCPIIPPARSLFRFLCLMTTACHPNVCVAAFQPQKQSATFSRNPLILSVFLFVQVAMNLFQN